MRTAELTQKSLYMNHYSEENMYKYLGEFAKNVLKWRPNRLMQWMPFKLGDEMKFMDEIFLVRKNVGAVCV